MHLVAVASTRRWPNLWCAVPACRDVLCVRWPRPDLPGKPKVAYLRTNFHRQANEMPVQKAVPAVDWQQVQFCSHAAGWWGGFYLCEKRVLNHQDVFGLHVAVEVPTLVHEGQAVKNLLASRRRSHSSRGARVFQASEQDTRLMHTGSAE